MEIYDYILDIFQRSPYPSLLVGIELQVTRVQYVKYLEAMQDKQGSFLSLELALAESPVTVALHNNRKIIFKIID